MEHLEQKILGFGGFEMAGPEFDPKMEIRDRLGQNLEDLVSKNVQNH